MARLLYIQSAPIAEISYSIKAGDAFVTEYSKRHRGAEIVKMNLFDVQLPAFDAEAVSAKYKILHGREHSDKDRRIWDGIKQTIEQFTSADKYVLALGMGNF